jgi:hypothetical protein
MSVIPAHRMSGRSRVGRALERRPEGSSIAGQRERVFAGVAALKYGHLPCS